MVESGEKWGIYEWKLSQRVGEYKNENWALKMVEYKNESWVKKKNGGI